MYADIVIDISHESLDRPFQYRIPESLVGQVQPGMWVLVPFGRRNTQKKGFVLKLGTKANIDPDRIKELTEIISDDNSSDKTRIALAVWMYREYGGNLIQSLRVVMPARKNVSASAAQRSSALDGQPRHWAKRVYGQSSFY